MRDLTEPALAIRDRQWRLYINGNWRESGDGETRPVIDPATGEAFGATALASTEDVDDAVRSARSSFESGVWWRRTSPKRRAAILLDVASRVDSNRLAYAYAESLNNGMPLVQAEGMVARCVAHLEYMASAGQRALGETIPVESRFMNYSAREPVGACALVIPWNGPLISAVWKLAPAIALGNSAVLKTSELTPITALMLARDCEEAGVPPGVVNIIVGAGDVGHHLVSHPGIDKVAFTGSTATGARVMAAAAQNISNITLELGGKSPNIFFEDVPVDIAASAAISSLFLNCGQVCVAGSRILVHEHRYDEFCEVAARRTQELVIGHGLNDITQVGPLISEPHMQRVLDYVQVGCGEGAKLLCGGERIVTPDLDHGYFVSPALFRDADNSMRISQEEIFGPVGVVLPFSSEDEAVRIANDTQFGLAAGVWTSDISRALRVSQRLRAGNVWINTYGYSFAESPLGGFKKSGIGRENGTSVIDMYTELKNVVIDVQSKGLDIFGVSGT